MMFPAPSVIEKIGQYGVIRALDDSGPVDVYLALGEAPDGTPRLCELKVVPRIEGETAELAELLRREAAVLSKLQHRAIASMLDLFEDEGRMVLVIEYVDGGTLAQLLASCEARRHRMSDAAIWFIGHEIASALAHAHEAADDEGGLTPVIHRNLRPENVLLSLAGQARLTGFALSKVLGRSPDTALGLVKGAPGYMAPEQLRGERVTPRTDVYGLGVLLWSMLTGRRPPISGPVSERLAFARPDLPRELCAAIDLALEPDPRARRITCTEIEQWVASETKPSDGRERLREEVRLWRNALVDNAPSSSPVEVTPTPGATALSIADLVSRVESVAPAPLPLEEDDADIASDPSPPPAPIEARPLSALESIGLAALTAAIVITAGVFIAERDLEVAPRVAPAMSAAASAPSASSAPARRPLTATSSGARTVRPPVPKLAADPKKLPAGMGYLTVASPGAGTVFINGSPVGDVNTPLEVACGRRFIRLGTSPDAGAVTKWLAPGQTVDVPCQDALRTEVVPLTATAPVTGIVNR